MVFVTLKSTISFNLVCKQGISVESKLTALLSFSFLVSELLNYFKKKEVEVTAVRGANHRLL